MEWDSNYRKIRRATDASDNAAHELTWSCFHNRPFFKSTTCCEWFFAAIVAAREQYRFRLWAYVVMPNHVHVLLWPQDNCKIEMISGSIKQRVARRATNHLRRHNSVGLEQLRSTDRTRPYMFWQDGGGYDRNMMSPRAIHASIDYIHNNPVRKALVRYAEDWPWSSAREWVSPCSGPVSVDRDSVPTLST